MNGRTDTSKRLLLTTAIALVSIGAFSACSSEPSSSSSASPTNDAAAFPNDNQDIDPATTQLEFIVPALQEYAKPYVDITVAGKPAQTYAQASNKEVSAYAKDQEQIAQQAITCMKSELTENPVKPALMLDVDETSLSNIWLVLQQPNLAAGNPVRSASAKTGDDTVIEATKELYQEALANDVTVFFMSGRSESERGFTTKNLQAAGFTEYEELILEADDNTLGAGQYKTQNREKLASEGWTIITNVGDQFSDINGADGNPTGPCSFKLPNPYYFIPWLPSGE